MGTLSLLIENTPITGPTNPLSALSNGPQYEQTQQHFKEAVSYSEPAHLIFFPQKGGMTVGGIYEVTGAEFLAVNQKPVINNNQIVSVPERPVDKGTWQAIVAGNQIKNINYNGPQSGVYLQPRNIGTSHVIYGAAPTSGVYTGDEGECK